MHKCIFFKKNTALAAGVKMRLSFTASIPPLQIRSCNVTLRGETHTHTHSKRKGAAEENMMNLCFLLR